MNDRLWGHVLAIVILICGVAFCENRHETVKEENKAKKEQIPTFQKSQTKHVNKELVVRQLDQLSKVGSKQDEIYKKFDSGIDVATKKMMETLQGEPSVQEVGKISTIIEILVESQHAYAGIELSRSGIILSRASHALHDFRLKKQVGAGDISDVNSLSDELVMQLHEKLNNFGPEKRFFEKARQHWQQLYSHLYLDDLPYMPISKIDLQTCQRELKLTAQFSQACRILLGRDLCNRPNNTKLEALQKYLGEIDKDINSIQEQLLRGELIEEKQLTELSKEVMALPILVRTLESRKEEVQIEEEKLPKQK